MHDILIALVFVSMVASPAIVAAFPLKDEDGSDAQPELAKVSVSSAANSR